MRRDQITVIQLWMERDMFVVWLLYFLQMAWNMTSDSRKSISFPKEQLGPGEKDSPDTAQC